MSLFSLACKLIPRYFKDYIKINLGVLDHFDVLKKIKRSGFEPKFIVDIGANKGDFADLARLVFSDSLILMVEPNKEYFDVYEAKLQNQILCLREFCFLIAAKNYFSRIQKRTPLLFLIKMKMV